VIAVLIVFSCRCEVKDDDNTFECQLKLNACTSAKADPLLLGLSSDLAEVSIAELWRRTGANHHATTGIEAERAPFFAESCILHRLRDNAECSANRFRLEEDMLSLLDG
jgi:hypothetical protein